MKILDKDKVLLRELNLNLYKKEILSFGKANNLTSLSKKESHDLLAKEGIERYYNLNNLKENIKYTNKKKRGLPSY